MTNLKYIGIGIAVFVLFIAGSAIYLTNELQDYGQQRFDAGFVEGQKSITPVSSRVDTIRDTVWAKPKSKPISKPIKDTSAVNTLVAELQGNNDSLKSFIANRMAPKTFLISDPNNRAIAVVNYDPMTDEYDGYVEMTVIEKDSNFVKDNPCPEPLKEEWYEDASMYAAGGATGILVVASGGTVLLGLGVTVGVSAVIAIF